MTKKKQKAKKSRPSEQVIDFTKTESGTVTMKWEYWKPDGTKGIGTNKIAKCPKCGRNGECNVRHHKQKDKSVRVSNSFYHVTRIVEAIPGFPLNMIDDHCEVLIKVIPAPINAPTPKEST